MLMTAAHASSPATAEVLISELKASQPEILQHIARSIPGTVSKHTDLICGARGREHPWQKWQTGHGDDEKDRQCSTGVARILTNHLDLHSGLVPVPRYVQATYRHLQRKNSLVSWHWTSFEISHSQNTTSFLSPATEKTLR